MKKTAKQTGIRAAASRAVGRPRKGETPMRQIAIRLPEPMLDAIDAQVEGRLDQPDRTAVIRELIAEALTARASAGGVKGRK